MAPSTHPEGWPLPEPGSAGKVTPMCWEPGVELSLLSRLLLVLYDAILCFSGQRGLPVRALEYLLMRNIRCSREMVAVHSGSSKALKLSLSLTYEDRKTSENMRNVDGASLVADLLRLYRGDGTGNNILHEVILRGDCDMLECIMDHLEAISNECRGGSALLQQIIDSHIATFINENLSYGVAGRPASIDEHPVGAAMRLVLGVSGLVAPRDGVDGSELRRRISCLNMLVSSKWMRDGAVAGHMVRRVAVADGSRHHGLMAGVVADVLSHGGGNIVGHLVNVCWNMYSGVDNVAEKMHSTLLHIELLISLHKCCSCYQGYDLGARPQIIADNLLRAFVQALDVLPLCTPPADAGSAKALREKAGQIADILGIERGHYNDGAGQAIWKKFFVDVKHKMFAVDDLGLWCACSWLLIGGDINAPGDVPCSSNDHSDAVLSLLNKLYMYSRSDDKTLDASIDDLMPLVFHLDMHRRETGGAYSEALRKAAIVILCNEGENGIVKLYSYILNSKWPLNNTSAVEMLLSIWRAQYPWVSGLESNGVRYGLAYGILHLDVDIAARCRIVDEFIAGKLEYDRMSRLSYGCLYAESRADENSGIRDVKLWGALEAFLRSSDEPVEQISEFLRRYVELVCDASVVGVAMRPGTEAADSGRILMHPSVSTIRAQYTRFIASLVDYADSSGKLITDVPLAVIQAVADEKKQATRLNTGLVDYADASGKPIAKVSQDALKAIKDKRAQADARAIAQLLVCTVGALWGPRADGRVRGAISDILRGVLDSVGAQRDRLIVGIVRVLFRSDYIQGEMSLLLGPDRARMSIFLLENVYCYMESRNLSFSQMHENPGPDWILCMMSTYAVDSNDEAYNILYEQKRELCKRTAALFGVDAVAKMLAAGVVDDCGASYHACALLIFSLDMQDNAAAMKIAEAIDGASTDRALKVLHHGLVLLDGEISGALRCGGISIEQSARVAISLGLIARSLDNILKRINISGTDEHGMLEQRHDALLLALKASRCVTDLRFEDSVVRPVARVSDLAKAFIVLLDSCRALLPGDDSWPDARACLEEVAGNNSGNDKAAGHGSTVARFLSTIAHRHKKSNVVVIRGDDCGVTFFRFHSWFKDCIFRTSGVSLDSWSCIADDDTHTRLAVAPDGLSMDIRPEANDDALTGLTTALDEATTIATGPECIVSDTAVHQSPVLDQRVVSCG